MILLSEMENLFAQLIVGPAATEQRQIDVAQFRENCLAWLLRDGLLRVGVAVALGDFRAWSLGRDVDIARQLRGVSGNYGKYVALTENTTKLCKHSKFVPRTL